MKAFTRCTQACRRTTFVALLLLVSACEPSRTDVALELLRNADVDMTDVVYVNLQELVVQEGEPIGPLDNPASYGAPLDPEVVNEAFGMGFQVCYNHVDQVCPDFVAGGRGQLLVLAPDPGWIVKVTFSDGEYSAEGYDLEEERVLSEN